MEKGNRTAKGLQEEIQECSTPVADSIDGVETHDFIIIVSTANNWKEAVVQIGHDDDVPFIAWMTACEYLIKTVAEMSGIPYDESVKLLKKGASEYTDVDGN